MSKIRAIIKRPDEQYGHVTNISNTLENLQRTVGGNIETVTLRGLRPEGKLYVVICDEEGRLKGKPFCCQLFPDATWEPAMQEPIDFYGDIAIVGADDDEFTDCPLTFDEWKRMALL